MSQPSETQKQAEGNGAQFHDDLLENLVGKWKLDRKMRSRTAENHVDVQWVLNHQFLQIHMKDVANPPQYEALVTVGAGAADGSYVVYWLDSFGGLYSEKGYGTRDGNSIKFVFPYPDGEVHNTFSWLSESNSWHCLIEQAGTDGQLVVFAEDTLTR